jgi:hypothetical protein
MPSISSPSFSSFPVHVLSQGRTGVKQLSSFFRVVDQNKGNKLLQCVECGKDGWNMSFFGKCHAETDHGCDPEWQRALSFYPSRRIRNIEYGGEVREVRDVKRIRISKERSPVAWKEAIGKKEEEEEEEE